MLTGTEYNVTRKAADDANAILRDEYGLKETGLQIHEIHPEKLGGSPTDLENKCVIPVPVHHLYNVFWYRL